MLFNNKTQNVHILSLIFLCIYFIKECTAQKLSAVDIAYQNGVKAYTEEKWSDCVTQFEDSLHFYKLYKSVTNNCRHACKLQDNESEIKENFEDLKIYEKFFNTKYCILKCKENGLNDVHVSSDIPSNIVKFMHMRKPYEYLHVCYFQMYALPKAASASFTYLVENPKDEVMKNNLQYYIEQPEVDINQVVDLEGEDYKVLYQLGLKAYNQNNWGETIASLEEVITDYLATENSCRAECEQLPEQESSPEFVMTVSNNIAALLYCQQQCQNKLRSLDYQSGTEFLADVLNYLQISYYHMERYNNAAVAVASYLALMPDDEDMIQNKEIYGSLTDRTAFVERSDIVNYFKQDTYEKYLLSVFHKGNDNNINSNAI